MSEEVTFYYNPRSRAVIVHWMLEEVGAPYRIVTLDMEKGEHKAPDFLAINPMGKLPAIVHHGVVVTETPAIIAYLADAFPAAGLAPAPGEPARGAYYRWLFFGAGCYEPAALEVVLGRAPLEGRHRAMAGWGCHADVLATLKAALAPGAFLLGDRFTAADLYIGSELVWGMMMNVPGLKDEPVFDAYVARLRERPAFRRSIGAG
ncbi:MAG: glutathione S-transferase family protein [Pseudomonadota bacterium]|nr:MAG: glutathione S-transferase [Pseudomonadota bacterium]